VLKIMLMFINLPLSYALLAIGKERQLTACTAAATALNVAANFALVPGYGRIGAAIASVMADVVLLVGYGLCLLWLRRGECYFRNGS
jgi:O-antigen/teichoic acid export membrane protein